MSKNQRLNATITIGSVLEASVKRHVGFLKTGLREVGDSIKDVERRQRELDTQRNVLRRQGQAVDHLDREYEQLEHTIDDLRRSQERWNRAAAASRRVGSTFNTMATDIGRNARRIAIGATLAGGAIFGLASSTAQLGDNVAKTADAVGIGIAELQELRYAAERSGVSTTAFDTALEKMTKNIGLAMEGTGAQKDALDALGLSAANLATMSPEEALGVIADRLQGVETQAEKAAIANDLFGRSGIDMINMLRGGSDGLNQLREDARRTGYVLSEQAARDAEVFQDTLLDTQLVLKGLKNTVGAELMPVVTQAMRRVGDTLVDNREDVQLWAESFADGVERTLPLVGEVFTGIQKVSSVVWDMIEGTAEMVGGWENFGIAVGAVLASRTIVRVFKFGAAVFDLGKSLYALHRATPLVVGGIRAIGSALMMNPVGAAVAVIAGGAALIYANWDRVGPWFKGLWGGVRNIFGGFGNFVGGVFTGDLDRAASGIESIWDGTKTVLGTVWKGIGGVFRASYDNIIKPVTDALGVTEPIEAAWSNTKTALEPVLTDIGDAVWGLGHTIDGIVNGDMDMAASGLVIAWEATSSAVGHVLKGIGGIFRSAYNNLIKPVTDALGLTKPIEQAWTAFSTAIGTTFDAIGSVFDTAWTTFIKPVIDGLSATGGIGAAWENVKATLEPILTWIGDKFSALMSFVQPVIDAMSWVIGEGAGALGRVYDNLIGETTTVSGTPLTVDAMNAGMTRAETDYPYSPHYAGGSVGPGGITANALGGPFGPGWHLTGELGPELKFENRSGYVANNRALRQLADYADRAGSLMAQPRPNHRSVGAVMDRTQRMQRAREREHQTNVLTSDRHHHAPHRAGDVIGRFPLMLSASNPTNKRNTTTPERSQSSFESIGAVIEEAGHGFATRFRPQERQISSDIQASRVDTLFSRPAEPVQTTRASATSPTQNITYTIHAAGASADEIIRLIERKNRQAAGNGLFDRVPATGPYGR